MLRKHLLATVAYYDCFDYPLTGFEVWKHLVVLDEDRGTVPIDFRSVLTGLRELQSEGRLCLDRGCYMLPGRESLASTRIHDEKISVAKLKRARRLVGWLRLVPFIRFIGISGSLALKKSDRESDWDFFVVVRSGRIWTGRTLLTLVLHLLGKRRHGRRVRNRACLNYYLTDSALEIMTKDVFAAHEYRFLLPLFDRERLFRRFELANRWIARFKPNFRITEIDNRFIWAKNGAFERVQDFLERLWDWPAIERWLASWQRPKILRNPKSQQPGSFIVATDKALIFLPQPKGPRVFHRFKTRLGEARA